MPPQALDQTSLLTRDPPHTKPERLKSSTLLNNKSIITAVRPPFAEHLLCNTVRTFTCLISLIPVSAGGGRIIICLCWRDWGAQRLSNLPRITLVISDRARLWSRVVWWQHYRPKQPAPCFFDVAPPCASLRGCSLQPEPPAAFSSSWRPRPCCCSISPSPMMAFPPSSPHCSGSSMPRAAASLSYDITLPENSPVKGKGPIKCELFLL